MTLWNCKHGLAESNGSVLLGVWLMSSLGCLAQKPEIITCAYSPCGYGCTFTFTLNSGLLIFQAFMSHGGVIKEMQRSEMKLLINRFCLLHLTVAVADKDENLTGSLSAVITWSSVTYCHSPLTWSVLCSFYNNCLVFARVTLASISCRCVSVCLSVRSFIRLSQVGVLLKRLNVGSCKQCHMISLGL